MLSSISPFGKKSLVFIASLLAIFVLIFFAKSGPLRSVRDASFGLLRPAARISRSIAESPTAEEAAQIALLEFRMGELKRKNEELESALTFSEGRTQTVSGARILLYARELRDEVLIVDQGTSSGIAKGDYVVTPDGAFVGTIREAGSEIAKIAIASSPEEIFEVQITPRPQAIATTTPSNAPQRSQTPARAIARGIGGRAFFLEFLSVDVVIEEGDFVAVRGERPQDALPIGTITRVDGSATGALQEAHAVMTARPERLERVVIIHSEGTK